MDHPTPDSFEQAFSAFLDSRQGDSAEEALFRLLRMAFSAGWAAADGQTEQEPG